MIFTDLFESPEPCPECGGVSFSDLVLAEKHDACYNKVRSRYKVWPSAYASGALVQCRKKGAANWGNKSKNESMAEGRDMCNVCGQTPCNCTHLNEAVVNSGRRLIELFNLIYSNGGDDAVDYLITNAPIFADYYDQYEGDLESIAAEVDDKELAFMVSELEEVAENEGLAEGYYDTGDYYDAHMGGEYGRDMSGSLAGGNRGNGPGRDDIHKGQTKHLPADPFGRASGKVPTSSKGKIYTKALPGEMDEGDKAKQDALNILKKQGVAEAFIAPALSAANANAEFERTKTFVPHGYKGRVDTEVSGKEEYRSVMSALKKLARAEGQHVESGLSGNKMSIFSKTMNSEALSDFIDMALQEFDQGVAEVSDRTLIGYLTKVAADAQKHPADPTKRSPEKASRSVGGFAQAFNKLDARKEPVNEISPEGPDSDEDYREWERLKDVRKQPYSPDWDDDDEKFMQKWYQERGLEETTDQEADYGKSYQDMVKRMGAKAREQEQTRPVDISDLARRLRDIEKKSGN